jgi:hypothetical protein
MRRVEPDPNRMSNHSASRQRSAAGKGGFRIEAMFVRRCSGSPVPISTPPPGLCSDDRTQVKFFDTACII